MVGAVAPLLLGGDVVLDQYFPPLAEKRPGAVTPQVALVPTAVEKVVDWSDQFGRNRPRDQRLAADIGRQARPDSIGRG